MPRLPLSTEMKLLLAEQTADDQPCAREASQNEDILREARQVVGLAEVQQYTWLVQRCVDLDLDIEAQMTALGR